VCIAHSGVIFQTSPTIIEGVLGVGAISWHGVPMKRVGWLRKLCLGSCVNRKERDNFDCMTIGARVIGTDALGSRATIAEATGGNATAAVALGALAIGGLALGFLVIGRLIIREMLIQRGHLRHLKIDQLEVEDLRVSKLTVLEEQRSAGGPDNPPAPQV
jgi:hypothetical protein